MVIKRLITTLITLFIIFLGGFIFFVIMLNPSPYTDKQCEKVKENFDKLKVGMSKQEIIPLIGGERKANPIFNPGKFKDQKSKWEVWALCPNSKNKYEWWMIVFDTKTNKVVKIFSGDPEAYGFL
jgi:hypothetical protein